MNWNPARPVYEQSGRTPGRLALAADGAELTYESLVRRASRLAVALRERGLERGSRIGILGSRSLIAVEAVLGAAWIGATYVPLGPRWPEERLKAALASAGLDAMIVDTAGAHALTPALAASVTTLVVPGDDIASALPIARGTTILSLESLTLPEGGAARLAIARPGIYPLRRDDGQFVIRPCERVPRRLRQPVEIDLPAGPQAGYAERFRSQDELQADR